jgi:mannan endo-1,4-beta-mannosidase
MKEKLFLLLLFVIALTTSCKKAQLNQPSDPQATTETRQLYYSLQRLQGAGILFGHHDDTGYGVTFKYDKDGSDVKSVTGSYPAVYGWDLSKIEHDSICDINGLPFTVQSKRIREVYERGGINTFCWHMDNPTDGKTAWDTSRRTVADILPGGAFNINYLQYLDRAAKYLATLKGDNGEPIPILFRPFHEATGDWFWWGKKTCTPDEFKRLWRFTIDYLRNTKKLHNLLLVFSAADFNSEKDFMDRYPGDGYADLMGFDEYCLKDLDYYQRSLDRRLTITDTLSAKHHKLSALAETGYLDIPMNDWWTNVLLPTLRHHSVSYVLVWRNSDTSQFYAPYPGQRSADDFKTFYRDSLMIFQDRLTPMQVYGKKAE